MSERVAQVEQNGPSLLELGIFAYAWLALLGVDLALRAGLRPRVDRGATDHPPPSNATTVVATRLARWVAAAARRHLHPMYCLPRAIVLRHLLRCRGISSRLRIGVRRFPNRLGAHAWVELAGRPLAEAPSVGERYLPLESWESNQ